ncbi:hypothetical protein D3C80_730960 [compost metagenome]
MTTLATGALAHTGQCWRCSPREALADPGRALASWVKYSDSAAHKNSAWPLPTCS